MKGRELLLLDRGVFKTQETIILGDKDKKKSLNAYVIWINKLPG